MVEEVAKQLGKEAAVIITVVYLVSLLKQVLQSWGSKRGY